VVRGLTKLSFTPRMANDEAVGFLNCLLNKTLHVSISDGLVPFYCASLTIYLLYPGRFFTGSFRCTDRVRDEHESLDALRY
jgi:hypothetical protein